MHESYRRLVENLKVKAGDNLDRVLRVINKDPDYFWMEGGPDDSFGHTHFLSEWGSLMPEVAKIGFVISCPIGEARHESLAVG